MLQLRCLYGNWTLPDSGAPDAGTVVIGAAAGGTGWAVPPRLRVPELRPVFPEGRWREVPGTCAGSVVACRRTPPLLPEQRLERWGAPQRLLLGVRSRCTTFLEPLAQRWCRLLLMLTKRPDGRLAPGASHHEGCGWFSAFCPQTVLVAPLRCDVGTAGLGCSFCCRTCDPSSRRAPCGLGDE